MHLSQNQYVRALLHKTNKLNTTPQPTPMISSLQLCQDGFVVIKDPTVYRLVVEALRYILITRSELSYVVNKTCQYMTNSQEHH